MKVRIYSTTHHGWWRNDFFGFTNFKPEAGIYEKEEIAVKYPKLIDSTKEDPEYLVPVADNELTTLGLINIEKLEELLLLASVDGKNTKAVIRKGLEDLILEAKAHSLSTPEKVAVLDTLEERLQLDKTIIKLDNEECTSENYVNFQRAAILKRVISKIKG